NNESIERHIGTLMAQSGLYSYAMPNSSQLELDSLEELDEFDYDPNFFDGITFTKDEHAVAIPGAIIDARSYPDSPSLTGYTSEESGYSSNMSVDDHHNGSGGKWSPTSDSSSASSSKRTINDGMMTNGKTSMFRGVTRTSKTAWGAKYSSKRIVNTCKTEQDAARQYDEYLKLHVPDKYLKYANFCPTCDKYTNSLGLPWAVKECRCSGAGSAVVDMPPLFLARSAAATTPLTDDERDYRPVNDAAAATSTTLTPHVVTPPSLPPIFRHGESTDTLDDFADLLKDEPSDLIFQDNDRYTAVKNEPDDDDSMMLRTSSSLPDDEILSAILNAPANSNMFGSFQSSYEPPISSRATPATDAATPQPLASSLIVTMETYFLRKYFRNDRKNLQCFPYCREHGNYFEAKMNGLEHTGKGVCRAPVKAKLFHGSGVQLPPHVVVLARCQRKVQPGPSLPHTLTLSQLTDLQAATWVRGTASDVTEADTTVYFLPEVWKFDGELPKKRRLHDDSDDDDLQYCVHVAVFGSADGGSVYTKLTSAESNVFDIQSTRTLLRQKQRKNDTMCDLQIGVPEKKKLKILVVQNHQMDRAGSIVIESSPTAAAAAAAMSLKDEALLVELDLEKDILWSAPGEPIDDAVHPDAEISPDVAEAAVVSYAAVHTPSNKPPTAATPDGSVLLSWKERFVAGPCMYSLLSIPLGVVFLVLHVLVLPFAWVGGPLLHLSDSIADVDLYLANSLSPPEEPHTPLKRLSDRSGLIGRVGYYVLVKVPVALLAFVASFALLVVAVVAIVVPPVSRAVRVASNASAMLAVDGCKRACGQKTSASRPAANQPPHHHRQDAV
ncbi:hypothetical protein DYB37_012994, partial [Aphanomyces astaci]